MPTELEAGPELIYRGCATFYGYLCAYLTFNVSLIMTILGLLFIWYERDIPLFNIFVPVLAQALTYYNAHFVLTRLLMTYPIIIIIRFVVKRLSGSDEKKFAEIKEYLSKASSIMMVPLRFVDQVFLQFNPMVLSDWTFENWKEKERSEDTRVLKLISRFLFI